MDKQSIRIIPFASEKEWLIWPRKSMTGYGIKDYNLLLTGDVKNRADDAEETEYKGFTVTFKLLNKTGYNKI